MSREGNFVPDPRSPYTVPTPNPRASGGGSTTSGAYLDPNGNVSGSVGDTYFSAPSLGGDGTSWVKVSGDNTSTGWE